MVTEKAQEKAQAFSALFVGISVMYFIHLRLTRKSPAKRAGQAV